MHRAKLRWWAFRQFLHCSRLMAKEFFRSLRVHAAKGKWRRRRFTGEDLSIVFKEDILITFRHGHLNQMSFVSLEDDFPELKAKIVLSVDRIVRAAAENLARVELAGVERTGILPGYAAAQRLHLLGCDRCRSFVCGTIVGNMLETNAMRALLKKARDTDPV